MRNVWTIASREYKLYFASPVAYLITFIILAVIGAIFFLVDIQFASQQGAPIGLDIVFYWIAILLMFFAPIITARLLAEEQRMGTIELLLTAPVRDWELVVGKWLGAFLLMLTIVAFTIVYPLILNRLVSPGIDQGPVITGYLGVVLLCAAFAAVGVAVSAIFTSQIAAWATTLGVLFFLWLVASVLTQLSGGTGPTSQIFGYLNIMDHFNNNLVRGVVDLQDIVFYLSLTALGLFVGTMAVETRRWR
jgi:ABC-2 type transport system permease protein